MKPVLLYPDLGASDNRSNDGPAVIVIVVADAPSIDFLFLCVRLRRRHPPPLSSHHTYCVSRRPCAEKGW